MDATSVALLTGLMKETVGRAQSHEACAQLCRLVDQPLSDGTAKATD